MSNILIVEDIKLVAEDIAQTVRNFGHNVVGVVSSSHEALDVASKLQVDIALLDMNLKGSFEGLKLGEILNVKYSTSIIFITAYDENGTHGTNYNFKFLPEPYDELKLHELLSKTNDCMEE